VQALPAIANLLDPHHCIMTTTAPPKTHCPNCGAKLHRPDLSLCAYCAMPLDIGATTKVDDETILRLKRMREHANFPAAMAFTPRDPRVERKAARILTYGSVALVSCIVAGIIALVAWWSGWSFIVPSAIAAAFLVLAITLFVVPASMRRASDARPLLKRPALVVVRRSEMSMDGQTNYYFTLRFDDGSEGEFQRPGLGTMCEPMANGYSGIAYSRGAELVDFRRLT
jgi:hypothetical protein